MLGKLKSFVVVSVFTLLIWFAADRNVSTEKQFEIKVAAASETDYDAVINDAYDPITLEVTMYGRRVHLEEFTRAMRDTIFKADLSSVIEEGSGGDRRSVKLLLSIPEIEASHLEIRGVAPPNVRVRRDELVQVHSITIAPNYGSLQVVAESLPKVSARIPRRFAEARLKNRQIEPDVEAMIRESVGTDPDDASFQVRLPISIGVDSRAPCTFTPSVVTLKGVVQTPIGSVRKGPIIVNLLIPDEVQSRFVVVLAESADMRPDIDVVGPKSQIDRLSAQDVLGFVEIKAAFMEQPDSELSADVRFVFPPDLPGLRLAPSSRNLRVDFKLIERSAAKADGS